MELEDVAEELYAVPPGDFIGIRDERAKQAKADGDKALAAEITKLRRPTAAAWLVNLLVREHPDELDGLLDLGGALRQAQLSLSGEELRQLSTQRHKVVNAMARRAVAAAADRGHQASPAAIEEVRQTLQAALADPDTADQVRAGRMLTSATYSGFGPARLTVVRGGAAPVKKAAPAPKKPATPPPGPDPKVVAKAQAALDAVTAELADAAQTADTERAAADEADQAAKNAAARVQELRTELRQAERDEQSTQRTRDSARRTAKASERERGKVQRKVDEAQFALERAQKGRR